MTRIPPHGGPDLRSAAEIRAAERELRRAGIVESVDIADGIRQLQAERLALIGQVTRLHAAASEMRALLLRTMTDSTVTTSDDPGCFHCDSGSGHSDKCEAVAAVVRYGQVTRLQERLADEAASA